MQTSERAELPRDWPKLNQLLTGYDQYRFLITNNKHSSIQTSERAEIPRDWPKLNQLLTRYDQHRFLITNLFIYLFIIPNGNANTYTEISQYMVD